jgi:hypothetical protein
MGDFARLKFGAKNEFVPSSTLDSNYSAQDGILEVNNDLIRYGDSNRGTNFLESEATKKARKDRYDYCLRTTSRDFVFQACMSEVM